MSYNVRFIQRSGNRKTGPIPVTSTPAASCSVSCPLNIDTDGSVLTLQGKLPKCYAGFGPTALHWRKLSNGDDGGSILTWKGFIAAIRKLPNGALWRHNEAGDLPTLDDRETLDSDALESIVRANKGKRGFTYTHHRPTARNRAMVLDACRRGFTINLSANGTGQAAEWFKRWGLPTVTLLPMDAPNVQHVSGVKIVACPAEKSDKVQCSNCKLCHDANRDYVIGFRAHGTARKKTDKIAREYAGDIIATDVTNGGVA